LVKITRQTAHNQLCLKRPGSSSATPVVSLLLIQNQPFCPPGLKETTQPMSKEKKVSAFQACGLFREGTWASRPSSSAFGLLRVLRIFAANISFVFIRVH
jgi:hypothetical protein